MLLALKEWGDSQTAVALLLVLVAAVVSNWSSLTPSFTTTWPTIRVE